MGFALIKGNFLRTRFHFWTNPRLLNDKSVYNQYLLLFPVIQVLVRIGNFTILC